MFYLTTHSTHFIYGYMASDIWLRTILIVRKETHFRHIGYSYRLTPRVLLYAPSHRQDNTYHSICYTSCGAWLSRLRRMLKKRNCDFTLLAFFFFLLRSLWESVARHSCGNKTTNTRLTCVNHRLTCIA